MVGQPYEPIELKVRPQAIKPELVYDVKREELLLFIWSIKVILFVPTGKTSSKFQRA